MNWEDKLIKQLNSGNNKKIYAAALAITTNSSGSNTALEYILAGHVVGLMTRKMIADQPKGGGKMKPKLHFTVNTIHGIYSKCGLYPHQIGWMGTRKWGKVTCKNCLHLRGKINKRNITKMTPAMTLAWEKNK